jgi:hypothetical protein
VADIEVWEELETVNDGIYYFCAGEYYFLDTKPEFWDPDMEDKLLEVRLMNPVEIARYRCTGVIE